MLILRGKQPLKRRHRAAADLVSTLAPRRRRAHGKPRTPASIRSIPGRRPTTFTVGPSSTYHRPTTTPSARLWRSCTARHSLILGHDASREHPPHGLLPGTFPRRPATARTLLCARYVPYPAHIQRKAPVEASASSCARCQLAHAVAPAVGRQSSLYKRSSCWSSRRSRNHTN